MSSLQDELTALLAEPVRALRPVSGGDINDCYQATLASGARVFVKTHRAPPANMYRREAEGLTFLAEPGALRVPQLLAVSERALVLGWIDSAARRADFDEQLGRGLAQLHRSAPPTFGLSVDNFIGPLPQANTPLASWSSFYGERRLMPLARRAHQQGLLSAQLLGRFDTLCTKLPALCGPAEPAARLHGDLWSGNVMSDERGAPVLIDPAVYGGHREVDLAMLQLFGAPSARLFAAYDEVYPRAPGAEQRVALYQLYPLLVHVCLFGRSYLPQLTRALSLYA